VASTVEYYKEDLPPGAKFGQVRCSSARGHSLSERALLDVSARDFVARHPGRGVPELHKRLEAGQPMPFFRELVCRPASFLESESLRAASTTPES